MLDGANWPRAIDWFAERSPVYEQALAALSSGECLDRKLTETISRRRQRKSPLISEVCAAPHPPAGIFSP